MLAMFKRMAIWAQDFEIAQSIVCSISVANGARHRKSGEKGGKDQLNRALAAGEREAEAQRQAKAMLEGKSISGRDRAKLRRP